MIFGKPEGIYRSLTAVFALVFANATFAQDRVEGTAIVRVDAHEYTIPIECTDARKPMLGVYTEPKRVTRERVGRASGVRLTVRPWRDTGDMIVTLDRYVGWALLPPGSGGVLNITLDMSPVSRTVDGKPQTLTYEQWKAGERSIGLDNVYIRADCRSRDPDAPAYRKLPVSDST